jgi:small conductance mechanosensitive channel
MDFNSEMIKSLMDNLITFGLKALGALALWVIGGWVIKALVENILVRGMNQQKVDSTVIGYVRSTVIVALKITLAIAILGLFGVQTTSFAGILAAVTLAIGVAWSGLLSNFAAGAFLVILRPFKTGDFISAGGVTGTVHEVGLFVTTINTPDNIHTFVGNNKIFSDNIQNFSTNPYRRVELVAQLDHTTDHQAAIAMLKDRLAKIPNVVAEPKPDVEILTFTPMGPVLAVRPYVNNNNYWQVYFETNKLIRESFGEAGYAVPQQHYAISGKAS